MGGGDQAKAKYKVAKAWNRMMAQEVGCPAG
jgi:hypothetical protein